MYMELYSGSQWRLQCFWFNLVHATATTTTTTLFVPLLQDNVHFDIFHGRREGTGCLKITSGLDACHMEFELYKLIIIIIKFVNRAGYSFEHFMETYCT